MKKYLFLCLALVFAFSFTSCGKDSAETATSTDKTTASSSPTEETVSSPAQSSKSDDTDSKDDSSNTTSSSSGKSIEAGLGDLVLYYNKNWTYDESQSADNSLVFVRDNALIGVSCSEEDSFQSPKDMAKTDLSLASGSDGYKLLQDMTERSVNGEKWIEVKYQTGTGDETQITLKRFYGKNYYAYSISYMAYTAQYDDFSKDATRILNSTKMDVPDDTGAKDAMKTLVGNFDMGDDGYLILNKDNTYAWYASKDKDKDNYHSGTFACDNQIKSLDVTSGHGLYLVLYPETFYDGGKESDMGTYKIELAISTVTDDDADYDFSGLNMKTSKVYYFKKEA